MCASVPFVCAHVRVCVRTRGLHARIASLGDNHSSARGRGERSPARAGGACSEGSAAPPLLDWLSVSRFCRHNRFIERCPICRDTVPGLEPPAPARRAGSAARSATGGSRAESTPTAHVNARRPTRRPGRGPKLRISHERRAPDDGYRCALVPGLRASGDAERLAEEIAFADGRLVAITTAPPDLYGDIRDEGDGEQAIWMCFLAAYLSALETADPFAGVRRALAADWRAGELPDLAEIPLGPRTSHDPTRGDATLRAYLHWVGHASGQAGSQRDALVGDPDWNPQRRFERIYERLRLPGLGRMGRYDLLVTLGRVGLCELRADALHFDTAPGPAEDLATAAAKRLFAIGDTVHLERRAAQLAEAMSVPIEALDLAFANWGAGARATLGAPAEVFDQHALERARAALELEAPTSPAERATVSGL